MSAQFVWTVKLGDDYKGQSKRKGAEGHIDLVQAPQFPAQLNERGTHGSGLSAPGVPMYGDLQLAGYWTTSSPNLRVLQAGKPIKEVTVISWMMDPDSKKPVARITWTLGDCSIRNVQEGSLDEQPDFFELNWKTLKTDTKTQDPDTGALGASIVVVYDRYEGVIS